MLQLQIPGFPAGAICVNATVSVLEKDGHVTYFLGSDNYFMHPEGDAKAQRFAIATLIRNGHMRAVEVERSSLAIPHRTLMRWLKQLDQKGPDSFFREAARGGPSVMSQERCAECAQLLSNGKSIPDVARHVGLNESTIRKAVGRGAIVVASPTEATESSRPEEETTKSARTREDAEAAEGMGTACTRAGERIGAALNLIQSAATRHQPCQDLLLGGVLAGLPGLCANGLLTGLDKHLSLPNGYYSAMHILLTLGYMALARIRRPEGLRSVPPGELGKVIGLDRVPEARTLREKIALMAVNGSPDVWMKELATAWMEEDPDEAGYLYLDGHVRVYHGANGNLPRRYVSREKLCLRGTTDYWINDALGRPFFVVSKAVTEGLGATLIQDLVPQLLTQVPNQPSAAALDDDPLLHRFVMVFDREGANYSLLSDLWKHRIGALTYRKAVKDRWPDDAFEDVDVPMPGGGLKSMKLARRETLLSSGKSSMPVLEVRRLSSSGHQTAIITSARRLKDLVVAGRMFARWCQENFFAYMMKHYDIDGLIEYGFAELPDTVEVINPAWRDLDKAVKKQQQSLRLKQAELGSCSLESDGKSIQDSAELVESIQRMEQEHDELKAQRKATLRKIPISELPEDQRPRQLKPLSKMLTDTVKMIAYRAETALVGLLHKHIGKESDARAVARELFVSSADICPDSEAQTLTIRIHRMACPTHDRAVAALLADLTAENCRHPETGMRMIYELA